MRSEYWEKKRCQRYEELKKDPDQSGLRRLQFGAFIARMRALIGADYSQGKAAFNAKITRIQWNRIENGHVVPRPSNIPEIAYAVNADPVVLFKMAGLAMPDEYSVYDRKGANKKLDFALNASKYLSDFLKYMAFLWRQYQYEQMMIPFNELYSTYPSACQELLAQIMARLAPREVLVLARELIYSLSIATPGLGATSKRHLYDEIDERLGALRIEPFFPPVNI